MLSDGDRKKVKALALKLGFQLFGVPGKFDEHLPWHSRDATVIRAFSGDFSGDVDEEFVGTLYWLKSSLDSRISILALNSMTDVYGVEGLGKHMVATNSRCPNSTLSDFQFSTYQFQTGLGHQAPLW